MKTEQMYIIKVLDVFGKWYNNAYIENTYDAVEVALFYRNVKGYTVQLWHDGRDWTSLLDNVKKVSVPKDAL